MFLTNRRARIPRAAADTDRPTGRAGLSYRRVVWRIQGEVHQLGASPQVRVHVAAVCTTVGSAAQNRLIGAQLHNAAETNSKVRISRAGRQRSNRRIHSLSVIADAPSHGRQRADPDPDGRPQIACISGPPSHFPARNGRPRRIPGAGKEAWAYLWNPRPPARLAGHLSHPHLEKDPLCGLAAIPRQRPVSMNDHGQAPSCSRALPTGAIGWPARCFYRPRTGEELADSLVFMPRSPPRHPA
jgi:hypothetical protein